MHKNVRLLSVLYVCVWAGWIAQRVHHIENHHIVGSQAHTNGFYHRALSLSLYLSLFEGKVTQGWIYLSLLLNLFPHFNLCFFFFSSSLLLVFFFYPVLPLDVILQQSTQVIFVGLN